MQNVDNRGLVSLMSERNVKCERCGFIADDTRKLIQHLRDEEACPPTHSTLTHTDIIERLVKILDLTCSFCGREFTTKAGKANHVRSCKENPTRVQKGASTSNVASTSTGSTKQGKKKNLNANANTSANLSTQKNPNIFPFDKDLTLADCGCSSQEILSFVSLEGEGIGKFFSLLHNKPEHKNIKWQKNKYVVYDGEGWIELDDNVLSTHIGMLYSVMEEVWCDYEMEVRCESATSIYDNETVAKINKFMYETIVDDDSVMFHCEDWLMKYLDGLKSK